MKIANPMKSLLFLLASVGLLNCQSKDDPTDTAARASGRYIVQVYRVDGDTLLSTKGINKLGVSNYYIEVSRLAADSVQVMNFYSKNGSQCGIGSNAHIQDVNGTFQLSASVNAPSMYQSTIQNGVFYQRTVGMNVDSLNARWQLDSLKSSYKVPYREVIISAQK